MRMLGRAALAAWLGGTGQAACVREAWAREAWAGDAWVRREAPVALAFVHSMPAPPAGFSAATASDAMLARYGLPPRPVWSAGAPLGYDAWVRAMGAARFYVPPVVRIGARRHGPPMALAQTKAGASTSSNWAGEALLNGSTGYGGSSYTEVLGQWVVSSVQQPVGSCGGTDVSATWVGIDGSGSADVLQAGTEADASCTGGVNSQSTYAWFEWYPSYEYQIANFPVRAGSSVFVLVQATGATSANATLVNLQTGQYTVVAIGAPSGTALKGNSAEWVVERPAPGTSNSPGTLADFGMIQMASEVGYLVSQLNTPGFMVPGSPGAGQTGTTITMVDSIGNGLASSMPESISAEVLQVEGAAK